MVHFPVKLRDKKVVVAGVGAAMALVSVGALAATYVTSADGVIQACVDSKGNLRLPLDKACKKEEQAISWNKQGPVGPIGPAGVNGAVGAAGPAGANGVPGANGAPGTQGAQGVQGPQGVAGPAGPAGASCDGGGGGSVPTAPSTVMYLKIANVQGESISDKHKDEIDVEAFAWGQANSGSLATGGGGAGKTTFRELSLRKRVDKASVALMKIGATGEHIANAVLYVDRASDGSNLATIKLSDVLVSSLDVNTESDGKPLTETVALSFGKIEFAYTAQTRDGTPDATRTFGYDIRTGRAD